MYTPRCIYNVYTSTPICMYNVQYIRVHLDAYIYSQMRIYGTGIVFYNCFILCPGALHYAPYSFS